MQIKQIENKQEWEKFILKQKYTPFVQSWNYGEFYKLNGEDYWVYGIYEEEKLIGGAVVLSTHARRGNYLYIPYGPIIESKDVSDYLQKLKEFTKFLKKEALKKKYSFIKASPFIDFSDDHKKIYKKAGYRKSPLHALAENTWITDLGQSEDEIMTGMKKNHRNLVRRCTKEKVEIEFRTDGEALEGFNRLHSETAKRHKFHRFSEDYIKNEFKIFSVQNQAVIINAYLPDRTLDSSAIIMYYGNMAAYRHGASLGLNKKIPTSYLIQWEAIKEAKKRGMKWYNFWGIAPDDASKKHPFYGITHFKKGFGGFKKDLLHCQDFPVSYKYHINWTIEAARKIKRGF